MCSSDLAINARGLRLSGTQGEHLVRVPALDICNVQQLEAARIDIAFICMKLYDTAWATALIKPYLARDGIVVTMQNGLVEEDVARIAGWGRTLGAIASTISVEAVEPGHITRTQMPGGAAYTVFRVGELSGQVTPRAQHIAELLKAVDSSKVTDNLWGERWSKLVINAMRNGLSAATGLSGNQRDLSEHPRDVSIRLGGQAVRVGQALGFQLEKLQVMDAETLARAGEGSADAKAEIVDQLVTLSKTRSEEQRPSMAQDIFKGRRTETDFINGFVAAKGEEIGVPAPLHARMNELVKKVERREVKASADLIKGL